MKGKRICVLAAGVFVAVALLFWGRSSRELWGATHFAADRAVLEALALRVLESGGVSEEEIPAPWTDVSLCNSAVTTVQFDLGGSGFGSGTAYWGVNYVPSDEMVGFQGLRWDYWKQDGDGRMYYEPEGDNTCYVKKLDDCWYYFEMRF